MARPDLIISFIAGAAIAAHRIVVFGVDDNTVVTASAATGSLIGVSDLGADAAGDRLDIIMDDIADVEYGGTVTRGDPITSDANGKAITATVAGSRVIGFAMVSGVVGDIGSINITPFKF
ncbi:MAG: DUF2190 family protein [Sulfuricurvum sp.]|nr:DUF2190 family protein [Sulfuricurvum sp.]